MKHGIVEIKTVGGAEPEAVFTDNAGAMGYVTDALTTLLSTQKAVVGYGSVVQKIALLVAGNAVATHSLTNRIGVSALGRTIAAGR